MWISPTNLFKFCLHVACIAFFVDLLVRLLSGSTDLSLKSREGYTTLYRMNRNTFRAFVKQFKAYFIEVLMLKKNTNKLII